MYRVKIHNSIIEIDKECWQKVTGDKLFMSYNWLKTFEESLINPSLPYYILIDDNTNIAAAAVCYLEKKNRSIGSIDNVLLGRIRNLSLIKNLSFLPALICGPKRSYGIHFSFDKGLKKGEVEKLQNQLLDIIENIANENSVPLCFTNILKEESSLIQLLNKRGYFKTQTWPLNYMNVEWNSFDEYKKYLGQRFSRMNKKVANEINKNKKSGVVIKILQNIAEHQERLLELLEMNHTTYNSSIFSLKPDYILNMKKNFGDGAIVYTAEKQGKINGVCVKLKNEKEAVLAEIGVDHTAGENDFTYFNIAYYEPIKDAIESGIKKIYAGNGLYKAKSKRGFSAADCFIFYKSRPGLKSFFIRVWLFFHYLWMRQKFSYVKKFNK
jgi:predicted N-acyltransferase